MNGITFTVTSPNNSSINMVTITTTGLSGNPKPISVEANGTINKVEIADLNADNSPEIYIFVNSAGSGSYASLLAYAVYNRSSISQISIPDLMNDRQNSTGYMGHDSYDIIESTFIQRFPLFDGSGQKTGKTRQIQYKLQSGESGFILKVSKVTEY
jgi:hypothetical protein